MRLKFYYTDSEKQGGDVMIDYVYIKSIEQCLDAYELCFDVITVKDEYFSVKGEDIISIEEVY